MKIYLDIILFENLCMNYIILFATGIVLKRKMNHIRLIISSLIGSIYAVILYLNVINITSNILMKVILSVAMIWLAFNSENYKAFFKDLLMFYLISFIFGGCSFALIYFIAPNKVKIQNGVLVGMYPIKVTLLAGAVAFIIIQIAFKITKNKLSADDMICTIEIFINAKSIRIKALIDSGNMLRDPISGVPVVVVEKDKLIEILAEDFIHSIERMQGGDYVENNYVTKIRFIPFSSLGKQNGMLVGIKADKVKIVYKEKEKYLNEIVIGIYNQKLTKDNKYNALLGLELLDADSERFTKSKKITSNL